MTAEIIVMNRIAVAMAADSLVSIRRASSTADSGAVKAYTGARKLVALQPDTAIGVMFFDSPDFNGMPWEVIFAEFGRSHSRTLGHVRDYAEAFLEFLADRSTTWTGPSDVDGLLRDLVVEPIDQLARAWSEAARRTTDARGRGPALLSCVHDWRDRRAQDAPEGAQQITMGESDLARSIPELQALVREIAPAVWRDSARRPSVRSAIVAVLLAELGRISPTERGRTGLAFAGFGESQLLPSAHTYTVSGRLAGGVRVAGPQSWELGQRRPAVVLPLAQDHMVQAFMTGIHPEIRTPLNRIIRALVTLVPGADVERMVASLEHELDAETDRLSKPLLDGLAFLSARDVAKLAKMLIAVTAKRNEVALVPDTVGGPFDVALISRSEGFTWHERARGRPPGTPRSF